MDFILGAIVFFIGIMTGATLVVNFHKKVKNEDD